MTYLLLFFGLSFLVLSLLTLIQMWKKKLKSGTMLSLFLFGILLSIPFVLIEHLALDFKYYFVILALITIEAIVIFTEHRWEFLHELIHHNVKHLRILSFFIISIGFTYSELAVYILYSHEPVAELMMTLPFKTLFALFTHTVLTSSATLITATETLVEQFFLFFLYYLRLIFISISHFLYLFFTEHHIVPLMLIFVGLNMYIFFRHKNYLDIKASKLIT